MEKDDLITGFSNLDNNEKRNAYNEEILRLCELLKSFSGIDDSDSNFKVHNYNSNDEKDIDEEEFLINEYKNILVLRDLIINCFLLKR